jgi:hypothetical protein
MDSFAGTSYFTWRMWLQGNRGIEGSDRIQASERRRRKACGSVDKMRLVAITH